MFNGMGFGMTGFSITDTPPADSIQIDVTFIIDGTDYAVLFVNPTTHTLGDSADFLYIETLSVLFNNRVSNTATTQAGYTVAKQRVGPAAVQNGDRVGTYSFSGYDGATFNTGATIEGIIFGAVSAGVVPMALQFLTSITDTASASTKMFILPTGEVGIGYGAAVAAGAQVDIKAINATSANLVQRWRNSANTLNMFSIRGDNSMDINTGGTLRSASTTKTITQTFTASSSQWELNITDSGPGSQCQLLLDGGVAPGSTLTLTDGAGNFVFEEFSVASLQQTIIITDGTYDTTVTQVGGATAPLWSVITADASNNNGFSVSPSEITTINPFRVTTGTITNPTATGNSYYMYSADIVAGNAAPHFKTELGDVIRLFKGAALTTALTTITFTAPGTPDFAIQQLTNVGGFGFVTADEGDTVLSVVANLQVRVNQLEARLQASGQIT